MWKCMLPNKLSEQEMVNCKWMSTRKTFHGGQVNLWNVIRNPIFQFRKFQDLYSEGAWAAMFSMAIIDTSMLCLFLKLYVQVHLHLQWNISISNFGGLWANFEISVASRYPKLCPDFKHLTFPLYNDIYIPIPTLPLLNKWQ